jgi:cytoskeletal protein CcmA (bactofilin family)
VQGNIIAQNADIEGEVKGKIEISELLVLKATAVVNGDIITGKMVVESGAVFTGTCKMGAVIKDIKIGDNGLNRAIPQQEVKNNNSYLRYSSLGLQLLAAYWIFWMARV